jgi:hypothetical protein
MQPHCLSIRALMRFGSDGIIAPDHAAPPGGPSAGALGALLRGHPKQRLSPLS